MSQHELPPTKQWICWMCDRAAGGMFYLKLGAGEACAWQERAKAVWDRQVSLEPSFSTENLGGELPTGSMKITLCFHYARMQRGCHKFLAERRQANGNIQ